MNWKPKHSPFQTRKNFLFLFPHKLHSSNDQFKAINYTNQYHSLAYVMTSTQKMIKTSILEEYWTHL